MIARQAALASISFCEPERSPGTAARLIDMAIITPSMVSAAPPATIFVPMPPRSAGSW
jgi:hypothetical protein